MLPSTHTSTNAKIHSIEHARSAALPSTLTSKGGRAQGENGMETKRHSVNLKQYRKVSGKWQFVPVARDARGAPDPRLVVIDGERMLLAFDQWRRICSTLFAYSR